MKTIVFTVGGIIIFFLILFLTISFLNEPILRLSNVGIMKTFVEMFAPPKDLYEYLLNERIDISKRGNSGKFKFRNKYPGRYSMGIILEKYSKDLYLKKYDIAAIIKLKFYSSGKLLYSCTTEKSNFSSFIGRDDSGFIFYTYDVSADLPIDKEIICEIDIVQPDINLSNTYGPIRFYIKKMSDL